MFYVRNVLCGTSKYEIRMMINVDGESVVHIHVRIIYVYINNSQNVCCNKKYSDRSCMASAFSNQFYVLFLYFFIEVL